MKGIRIKAASFLRLLCLILILAFGFATIVATGGGGGGGGGSTSPSGGTGSVALFVADSPADGCDAIWIYITEVSLIPAGGGPPVVVFTSKSPDGYKLNILNYKDEHFYLSVKDVPAGEYAKIRLRIAKIEVDGGPCDEEDLEIKLPSNKIDLNPRGPFRVVGKQCYNVTLDFDANKSYQLKPAGKSGKCIFRPVIFVDIEKGRPIPRCPRTLSGTIKRFIEREGERKGFVFERDGLTDLRVFFAKDVAIYNDDGGPIDVSELKAEDPVKVRGKLDGWHKFVASVVVVGAVEIIEGTVITSVIDSKFDLRPLGESSTIPVNIFDETLILFGCDTEVEDSSVIQPGMIVRVLGKDSGAGFNGIIVFLRELVGIVTEFDPDRIDLKIQTNGVYYDIFVPPYTPFYLVGDGDVSKELLCVGKQVLLGVDPCYDAYTCDYDFKAKEVQIQPDQFQGVITDIRFDDRILVVERDQDDEILEVYVPQDATILDLTETEGLPTLWFSQLIIGDNLNLIGLYPCVEHVVDFRAFVVLKIDSQS
jgi:hypothetical protein